ncbi:hypothetical protein QWY86_17080 [Pedobacter aquatilis]|uniref:hypothetical protein n=1 Tax=Pedobacter aquatilis TaxID=351343 RepID=UPI0025B3ECAD|nr:hypothetical protein [Pedobacter aquatilis]MDN3588400.1 hypothetical protein [Pedobacter aquatilis]
MTPDKAETKNHLKAIRLINIENDECTFEVGKIPVKQNISAGYFFAKTDTFLQHSIHPAPRKQYVITLKGKLKFSVTNGATFIIEPGIILIADDTKGIGHTWEIEDGEEWERIYIPLEDGANDYFVTD